MKKYLIALSVVFGLVAGSASPAIATTFGCGYVNPQGHGHDWKRLAQMYRKIGIHAVKYQQVRWENVEPHPPKNGIHNYQWGDLDPLIGIFQNEGFTDMEIVIEAGKSWATRPLASSDKEGTNIFQRKFSSLPPKPGRWKYYAAFMQSIVERYDGDGIDDMPGLKYPVLHYEIETEAQGSYHWLGTAEEYVQLLQTAYKAAKKANPKVTITLTGLYIGDVFNPDEPAEKRIETLNEKLFIRKNWYKYRKRIKRYLREKDYFDEVEIHALEDSPAIYTAVAWIRREMRRNGYQKPIYIGDATAVPTMTYGPVRPHPHPFPMTAEEVVGVLADQKHRKHQEVSNWYRAEQSRLLVRKSVAALELGLKKISFGFLMDHPKSRGRGMKILARLNALSFNWIIAGLIDTEYRPYPAYFTYELTVKKLKDAKFHRRVPLEPGVFGFDFSLPEGKKVYVFWSLKNAQLDFTVDKPAKAVRVTHIITNFSQQVPKVVEKAVVNGKVKLNFSEDPIFVEPLSK